jgi:hypothetical protein
MPKPIDARIRRYVTKDAPLGPSDAARITDIEVAAHLFDPHNQSFNSLLRKDLSVVIGRRGSGKTALLNSYKYVPYLGKIAPKKFGSDFRAYGIVIEISTYKKFQEMQRRVVRDGSFRPIEAVVDDWEKLIVDYFLATLVSETGKQAKEDQNLFAIQKYLRQDQTDYEEGLRQDVWGKKLWSMVKGLWNSEDKDTTEYLSSEDVLRVATKYLKNRKKKAVIIFDSMDEYPIGDPVFDRTIGALVRFITHFNTRYEQIKIKLGLPSEIFPEIQKSSGNPLKDLVSFDQVQWTAMELMQIAAYRYRLFLSLYDAEFGAELRGLDLSKRDEVHQFWSRFFPEKQTNRYDAKEDAMTYVMRHTQLLPRQFLMILHTIVVGSQRLTGGYRQFQAETVRKSIEEMEPIIAGEIFGAFKHVYPFAEEIGRAVFGNLPTILSYDKLDTHWRQRGRHLMLKYNTDFEMVHFCEMLIRMGILGLVKEETELYFNAKFGYGSLMPFNIGLGNELCLHPIFSKCFNASANEKRKPIAPQGATIES